jgi:hypothetical protein
MFTDKTVKSTVSLACNQMPGNGAIWFSLK